MKTRLTKQWIAEKAILEADLEVGAGLLSGDPDYHEKGETGSNPIKDESRLALGRFVNLKRRSLGLTINELADQADIETGELYGIEESEITHLPEPRTVYQLAKAFSVSHESLMILSGLAKENDEKIISDAVRYAARSESLEALNETEKLALDGLVKVLTERKA